MRKAFFTFIILLLAADIFGQDKKDINDNYDINRIILHENRFDKLIDLAESYMETNPEFALNCAYKAYEISNQTNDKKKSAHSSITIGNIFNINDFYLHAVSHYKNAINELEVINDYNTICKIYTKIAKLYQNNEFESKLSIEAMENALNYAHLTNSIEIIIEAYTAYAEIQLSNKNYKEALNYYNKALQSDINPNTIKHITQTLTSIANIKKTEKKYQEALTLIDSSLKLSDIYSFNDLKIKNYGLKGCILDSIKEFDSARSYYQKAIELAYSSKEFDECAKNMYDLGLLNMKHNNTYKAIEVFKILADSTETFKMYDLCYSANYQLSKCHATYGNYKEAYNFLYKYDVYNTIAKNQNEEKKIKDIHTSYLLSLNINELKAKELEDAKIRNYQKNVIILTSAIIIILISLVIILILFSKNKNLSHKSKETAYEQQLKIDQMENELMEIQLKNNKESLINLALHFKSYIEYINPLKSKLKEAIDAPESEQKNKLKNIYTEIQNNNSLFNNTENLHKQINEIYKDFIDRLDQKYPTLTKSEKRLCTMLYINMSSKEIAIISNTTIRSVETSRYRLRKKFNLTRDEDMVNFLRSI